MGYEYGDAQNSAVRCFLNQFSKKFNYFDEYYRRKTMEYFDNKCPYTGIDLTYQNSVRDHVVPLNRESCGLHVYGNVLIVSKIANSKKSASNLEDFLKDHPERLRKIQQFINETGYMEIHNQYYQKLNIACQKLYSEIGELIKKSFDDFETDKQIVENSNDSSSIIYEKKFIIPQKQFLTTGINIQKNVENKLSKSDIKYICNKNQFYIYSDFTKAAKNTKCNTYWANPNIKLLNKEWKLVLDDYYNQILYCFSIPANAIIKNNIVVRKDKPFQMDLQIQYNDPNFTDTRSKIKFQQWLIKEIRY